MVLSGTYLPQFPTISMAIGYAVGTNVIPTATYATVKMAPSASLGMPNVDYLVMDMGESATLSVSGSRLNVDANSANAIVTATATQGSFGMNGDNVDADITFEGPDGGVIWAGASNGHIRARGTAYTANPYNGAQVTLYGSGVFCEAYEVGGLCLQIR